MGYLRSLPQFFEQPSATSDDGVDEFSTYLYHKKDGNKDCYF